ncbi:DNA-processing protein DprA [Cyanobium gracile UHCC 0139]|uniref:DNA-processing protein DprA n=1 Tax=Cyanobium gracile UHCC 0139 TaxID=3110308 RepID=A0ABU5RYR5_9CYAN|nr:DNA-processing protein DprA [Cyanobium gracile]MEA5392795.1 DNA-processing protein DprA [Cyanobium gracile UHCC 0139]
MGDLVQGAFPRRAAPTWGREQRLWWLLWSRCPGLGWQRLRALEASCGGLAAAWGVSAAELAAVPGLGSGLVASVERFRRRWGPRPLEVFATRCRFGRGVLVPGDRGWPGGLWALKRPPLQLCWQGRGSLWPHLGQRRSVAVVGTRRPSLHGLSMAQAIGAALAEAGWPVVSGLAEGIDGAAHQGCLAAGGAPVGVLGTPLGRAYPLHHALLQRRVARQGLLVSEQVEGAAVRPGSFAARNRLLVAMAAAVVVVECPVVSGALHSAELAWQLELPLWVVPADAGRASALGSNRLMARGATPLLLPADLIDQLGPGPLARRGSGPAPPGDAAAAGDMAAEGLLAAVGGGASLEQLSLALDRPMAELMPRLLELELAGRLRAEAGLCWRPC